MSRFGINARSNIDAYNIFSAFVYFVYNKSRFFSRFTGKACSENSVNNKVCFFNQFG